MEEGGGEGRGKNMKKTGKQRKGGGATAKSSSGRRRSSSSRGTANTQTSAAGAGTYLQSGPSLFLCVIGIFGRWFRGSSSLSFVVVVV